MNNDNRIPEDLGSREALCIMAALENGSLDAGGLADRLGLCRGLSGAVDRAARNLVGSLHLTMIGDRFELAPLGRQLLGSFFRT